MDEWIVLVLSEKAEGEDPEVVQRYIAKILRYPTEVFVPASVTESGQDRQIDYLLQGYAFIKGPIPPSALSRVNGTRYVDKVLWKGNKAATVTKQDIDRLRSEVKKSVDKGVQPGDTVIIKAGHYKGLTGEVLCDFPADGTVQVAFTFRSKQDIVTLPRGFLNMEYVEEETSFKAPSTDTENRARALLKAIRKAIAHLGTALPAFPVTSRYDLLLSARVAANRYKDSLGPFLDLRPYLERHRTLKTLVDRFHHTAYGTPMNFDNVVVDGMNLVMRVFHALPKLSDDEGNSTEIVYGVIRTLASYVKQFPGARVYVAWDRGKSRRVALYDGYKANRKVASSNRPEVSLLETLLPLLGVTQVWSEGEEADDAVATLVAGELKASRNVLITSDRDYLQLVNDTTIVMCPGPSKTSIWYDPDKVVQEYGVTPDLIPLFKAITGDTSDNIPGIPRFRSKVAASLITKHPTVDALYWSGFAGLTAKEYTAIKAAEAQVRLNLKLTTLVYDLPLQTIPAAPDKKAAVEKATSLAIQDKTLDPFFSTASRQGFLKLG